MSFKPKLESSVVPGRSRGTQWFSLTTCHFYVGPLLWKGIGVMVCKNRHILTAPEHLLYATEDL